MSPPLAMKLAAGAYDLTAGTGDWTTTEVDLSASAGKILYAIGLQVESSKDVTGYR